MVSMFDIASITAVTNEDWIQQVSDIIFSPVKSMEIYRFSERFKWRKASFVNLLDPPVIKE